jgi:uncharacterized membrane protein YhaH (DUF805 family)
MFKNPFSFKGRIGRKEFILGQIVGLLMIIIPVIIYTLFSDAMNFEVNSIPILVKIIILTPFYWFTLTQNAKRCHDLGKSGWWQIVPFYFIWMIFKKGN